MSIEAVEAVVELIEMGAVVGNPAIVRCLRSALDEPQPRTWVGLTIEDREQIQQECFGKVPHHVAFAHAIEAKLKEKNNA
jgi:hypothetical protein